MKVCRSYLLFFALGATVLGIIGCSDIREADLQEASLQDQRFSTSCELDTDRLTLFFEQIIESELLCLKENLDLFMRVVETDRPGYLSQAELRKFVTNRMRDVDEEMLSTLDAFFLLSNLIFGEEKGYISKGALNKITSFAIVANREIVKIYPFLTSKRNTSFSIHQKQRRDIFNSFQQMASMLADIFVSTRTNSDRVMINNLIDKFTIDSNREAMEKIKSAIFFKKLFFGGDPQEITYQEFEQIIYKIPQAASFVFDIIRLPKLDFEDESSMYELIDVNMDILRDRLLYYSVNESVELFTTGELLNFIETYKESILVDFISEVKPYEREVLLLRDIFLREKKRAEVILTRNKERLKPENKDKSITPWDIDALIKHVKKISQMGVFYYRIYRQYRGQLASHQKVDTRIFNSFSAITDDEVQYRRDFARIINEYRFFLGSSPSSTYSYNYKRNAGGVFQIAAVEYIASFLFHYYGCPTDGRSVTKCMEAIGINNKPNKVNPVGGVVLSPQSLIQVFSDLENFLVGEELSLPTKARGTADNISLLSSLFLVQSNGDNALEINELTEFAITVLNAFKIADAVYAKLEQICPSSNIGIDSSCFKRNVISAFMDPSVIEEHRGYYSYFPNLFSFLLYASQQEEQDLIDEVRYTAMDCTDEPDIYITKGSIMSFFVVITNLESTIVRYDSIEMQRRYSPSQLRRMAIYRSNQLENDQLNIAFDVFRSAIEGIMADVAPGTPTLGGFTPRGVYRFLVREKRIPSGVRDYVRLAGYAISCPNCVAKRDTIGAILKEIRQSNDQKINREREEQGIRVPSICDIMRDVQGLK